MLPSTTRAHHPRSSHGSRPAGDPLADREAEHGEREPPGDLARAAVGRDERAVHDVQGREHEERLRRPVVQPAHDPPALLDELHVVHARPRRLRRRAVRRHQREPASAPARRSTSPPTPPSPRPMARRRRPGDRSRRAQPCATPCAPPASPRDLAAWPCVSRPAPSPAFPGGTAGSRRARSRPRSSSRASRGRAAKGRRGGVPSASNDESWHGQLKPEPSGAAIDRAPEVRAGHAPRPHGVAAAHEPRRAELHLLLHRPRVAVIGDERHALRLAVGERVQPHGLDPAGRTRPALRGCDHEAHRGHRERSTSRRCRPRRRAPSARLRRSVLSSSATVPETNAAPPLRYRSDAPVRRFLARRMLVVEGSHAYTGCRRLPAARWPRGPGRVRKRPSAGGARLHRARTPGPTAPGNLVGNGSTDGPCVRLQCQQIDCAADHLPTTTVSGVVYDPAGTIRSTTSSSTSRTTRCSRSSRASSATSAAWSRAARPSSRRSPDSNGRFVLTNAPAGQNIPLVLQLGKWRKQVVIPAGHPPARTRSCPIRAVMRLPAKQSEGDMPQIAVATGGCDAFECLLQKIGIDVERVHERGRRRQGARLPGHRWRGAVDPDDALRPASGRARRCRTYDLIVNSCECAGVPAGEAAVVDRQPRRVRERRRPALQHALPLLLDRPDEDRRRARRVEQPGVAVDGDVHSGGGRHDVHRRLRRHDVPQGRGLRRVAREFVGATLALGEFPIDDARYNVTAANPPSTQWVANPNSGQTETGSPALLHYTFNTPVGRARAEPVRQGALQRLPRRREPVLDASRSRASAWTGR